MPSNKDRLYAALYVEAKPPCQARKTRELIMQKIVRYHWALIVGPKVEADDGMGVRYHAKERPKFGGGSEWSFEERDCPLAPTSMLLVRVMVGKVAEGNRLVEILRNAPIREGQPGWNCVFWVKEALETLQVDPKALGTTPLSGQSCATVRWIIVNGRKISTGLMARAILI
ncbi:uncharacterized protein N7483_008847 [Penicillium malachiteum]|uniref:uncharacterized protein n=1 Tax=Penicillium malachiteum TaxID=1324776 RepID=UPI002546E50C|nr:uncharacterized protein N7483_008847 [Penicillium malachiteum]KAJ5720913.1 hypothetical protein N7483_008847 [Penicillium malachiteum]